MRAIASIYALLPQAQLHPSVTCGVCCWKCWYSSSIRLSTRHNWNLSSTCQWRVSCVRHGGWHEVSSCEFQEAVLLGGVHIWGNRHAIPVWVECRVPVCSNFSLPSNHELWFYGSCHPHCPSDGTLACTYCCFLVAVSWHHQGLWSSWKCTWGGRWMPHGWLTAVLVWRGCGPSRICKYWAKYTISVPFEMSPGVVLSRVCAHTGTTVIACRNSAINALDL